MTSSQPATTFGPRHLLLAVVLALLAAACGATRPPLDIARPWEVATQAVNHPPQLIDVVKPRLIDHTGVTGEIPASLREKVVLRSEAVDIRSLLLGLAKQTNLNITLDPDVTGQVSAFFNDVEVIDALNQIADQIGAEVEVHGNVISVHRPRIEFRMYRLHYLRDPRAGTSVVNFSDRAGTSSGVPGGGFATSAGQSMQQSTPTTVPPNVSKTTGVITGPVAISTPGIPTPGASTETMTTQFASNFWEDLGNELTTFVFEGDTDKDLMINNNHSAGMTVSDPSGRELIIDTMSGSIVVKARRNVLDDVGVYLKAVDETVHRQVIIDVRILEVSLSDQTIFSIDSIGAPLLPSSLLGSIGKALGGGTISASTVTTPLGFQTLQNATPGLPLSLSPTGTMTSNGATPVVGAGVSLSPITTSSTPTPYGVQLFGTTGANGTGVPYQLLVQALGQLTDVHIVSSPRLTALQNQKAILKIVREHVYFLEQVGATTLSATGVAVASTNTYYPVIVPEGVVLDMTPLVDDNGEVDLEIHPSFSTIADVVSAPDNQGSEPEVDRREFVTTVHVKGEETIMLGGLVADQTSRSESGIPLLKDIPFLGGLFRNTNSATTKSEIILLLTPRVQGPTVARDFVNGLRALENKDPIPVVAPLPEPVARPADSSGTTP